MQLRSWPSAPCALLGSHKRRDNRCALAAPKLEHGAFLPFSASPLLPALLTFHVFLCPCLALTLALEREGWEVHTQLSDPSELASHPNGSDELAQLKSASESRRVLILKTSHFGGHKFAGNVVVCLCRMLMILC